MFVLAFSASAAYAAKFEAYGTITFYYGVGKTIDYGGGQTHTLVDTDCATKIGFDNPPNGTLIWAKNLDNNKLAALQKWDTGTLPIAILDVMPKVFTNALGGVIDSGGGGVIKNGYYYHY